MGESPSARTEQELRELRGSIDRDLDALLMRARADLQPANLIRRQPVAVFGTLGSAAALAAASIAKRMRDRRQKRPDSEIERIIQNLGGNVEKLKGGARKRLREQLRAEVSEIDKPKRSMQEAAWGVAMAALTAGATEMARRMAGKFGDDDPDLPPRDTGALGPLARRSRVSGRSGTPRT